MLPALLWLVGGGLLAQLLCRIGVGLTRKRDPRLARLLADTLPLAGWLLSATLAWQSLPLRLGADRAVIALAKLVLLVLLVRLANRVTTRAFRGWAERCPDQAVATMLWSLAPLLRALIWGVGGALYLQNIGVQMAAIWALLSAGGIGAGLALKQPVQEFFNYITLLLDRPFQAGQLIEVNGITARVERVGVRSTRLRSLSGEAVVMSNSLLTGSVVTNFDEMQQRRVVVRFALPASSPHATLEQLPDQLRALVEADPEARHERCHCIGLLGNTLQFELVYGLEGTDPLRHLDAQQRINLALARRLNDLGLTLAAS